VAAKLSTAAVPRAESGLRSEAFRPRARLTAAPAFELLLRSRRSARSKRFLVQATLNGKQFARLGIIVGKRVARRAVDRNLLKRLVRESFRQRQRELAGFDLLVRPRRALLRDERGAAREELRTLLSAAVE